MATLFLKSGRLSKAGRETLSALLNQEYIDSHMNARLHGVRKLGSGRFISLSYTLDEQARILLTYLGVPFKEGNDAPRGGKTGQFLEYNCFTLHEKLCEWCSK